MGGMNRHDRPSLQETLLAILACAESWEPDARLLGNVRAGDMREAMYRAREAVAFVEQRAESYATALEIKGCDDAAETVRDHAARVLDDAHWRPLPPVPRDVERKATT
jgi:hypothetical protein